MPSDTQTTIGKARDFVRLREQFVFWSIVVVGVLFDLWTKAAVFEMLTKRYPPVLVIIENFFRLVVQENTGAAFGIASGQRIFLISISYCFAPWG